MASKNLLVFDSTNLLYMSYHGNAKLTGPDGSPTGAIYGFLVTMEIILKKFPDYQPVFVFDTFPEDAIPFEENNLAKDKPIIVSLPDLAGVDIKTRRDLYPAYKATRSPMPPDLKKQCWPLLLILNAMGHPVISGNAILEADDVLGTLAVDAQKRGQSVIVATGDKDMAALVSDKCNMYNFNIKKLLDIEGVKEKYLVHPDKVAGWLALMGDVSDNIPGVKKCGEVTAAKWMNTYGSIDNIIANAADIKGVVGENLRQAIPTLKLSLELTLLRTDTPIAFDACTRPVEKDLEFLRHLYIGLGLQKHLKKMDEAALEVQKNTHLVNEPT